MGEKEYDREITVDYESYAQSRCIADCGMRLALKVWSSIDAKLLVLQMPQVLTRKQISSRQSFRQSNAERSQSTADIEHRPQRQASNFTLYLTMQPHRCERGVHSALHLFADSNAPHTPQPLDSTVNRCAVQRPPLSAV
jgi:hypothetical protein